LIDVQRVMVSDDVKVVGGSADRLGSSTHPDAGKFRVGLSRNVFEAQGLTRVAVTVPSATGGLLLNDSVSVTVWLTELVGPVKVKLAELVAEPSGVK
jgi:hypothetical protein